MYKYSGNNVRHNQIFTWYTPETMPHQSSPIYTSKLSLFIQLLFLIIASVMRAFLQKVKKYISWGGEKCGEAGRNQLSTTGRKGHETMEYIRGKREGGGWRKKGGGADEKRGGGSCWNQLKLLTRGRVKEHKKMAIERASYANFKFEKMTPRGFILRGVDNKS